MIAIINSDKKIAAGSLVRLRSGGPLMTADWVEADNEGNIECYCKFDSTIIRDDRFYETSLDVIEQDKIGDTMSTYFFNGK